MAYTTDQKVVNVGGLKTFWNKVKQLLNGKVDKETGKGLLSNNWFLLFQNMWGESGTTTFQIPTNLHEALIVWHVGTAVSTQRVIPLNVNFGEYSEIPEIKEDVVKNPYNDRDIGGYSYKFTNRVLTAVSDESGTYCSVFVR